MTRIILDRVMEVPCPSNSTTSSPPHHHRLHHIATNPTPPTSSYQSCHTSLVTEPDTNRIHPKTAQSSSNQTAKRLTTSPTLIQPPNHSPESPQIVTPSVSPFLALLAIHTTLSPFSRKPIHVIRFQSRDQLHVHLFHLFHLHTHC